MTEGSRDMILAIPFDIEFDVSARFAGTVVELSLEMATEDGVEEMGDMFDCLCLLARLGTFSAREPGGPAAAWTSEAISRGAWWARTLSLGDVDLSFWRVLLQMSVQCHYHLASIHRLSVRGLDSAAASISVRDAINAPYLPEPSHVPFTVTAPAVVSGDLVTIRMTTAVPMDDDLFADVKKAFEDWGSLVYVGGFAESGSAIEEYQLERVEVARLHSTLVECAAFGWNAPREALAHAVRLCRGLHQLLVPIVEVEIE